MNEVGRLYGLTGSDCLADRTFSTWTLRRSCREAPRLRNGFGVLCSVSVSVSARESREIESKTRHLRQTVAILILHFTIMVGCGYLLVPPGLTHYQLVINIQFLWTFTRMFHVLA